MKTSPWMKMEREIHSILPNESIANSRSPQNPYQYEIVHSNYPAHLFNTDGPSIPPVPLEQNGVIWVDNLSSFLSMLEDLKRATEIAVDLEHHDYRSYYGFVCLMQISTRKQDWIIDTLELREELIALNQVFTDPNIIKVFPSPSPSDKGTSWSDIRCELATTGFRIIPCQFVRHIPCVKCSAISV
jgi:exosome complex exonuclease RRP6